MMALKKMKTKYRYRFFRIFVPLNTVFLENTDFPPLKNIAFECVS